MMRNACLTRAFIALLLLAAGFTSKTSPPAAPHGLTCRSKCATTVSPGQLLRIHRCAKRNSDAAQGPIAGLSAIEEPCHTS